MDEAGISLVNGWTPRQYSVSPILSRFLMRFLYSAKNKDGSTTVVSGPSVASSYRTHICAFDKADMLKSLYEIDSKSHKWGH